MSYWYIVNRQPICPICKQKITEHTEFQDKICKMITIKQFANNCPGFDVQFRPFFEDQKLCSDFYNDRHPDRSVTHVGKL